MTEYASLREKIAAEKAERESRYQAFEDLFAKAYANGLQAGKDVTPTPMVVSGYEHQPVMDGVCGFAWVVVRPGNSSFARWLVKTGRGRTSYSGGVHIWISAHGQSMTRKDAHAQAMADTFRNSPLLSNVRIYAESRMD